MADTCCWFSRTVRKSGIIGPLSDPEGGAMHIGEPLRTIIVEPLELPVNEPTAEPVPEPQEPEPTQEPATV